MATKDSKHEPTGSATETDHEALEAGARGKSRRRPPPTLDLAATEVPPPTGAKDTPPSEDAAPAEVPVLDADGGPLKDTDTVNNPDKADAEAPSSETPPPEPVHAAELPGTPAEAPVPKRQMGLVTGLIAALVSGVIGAAVALAVVNTFYSAEQNADAITQLEARALDLRQRVDAMESAAGGTAPAANINLPQDLATRLDALESGLADVGERVNGIADNAAPAPATSPEEFAALGGRLDALQQKVDGLPAPAPSVAPEQLTALSGKVDALQQQVAAIPAPPPAASPQDLATATARISALEQRLATVAQQQQASGQGAAQLVALSALQVAVSGGQPFTTELKATRALLGAGGEGLAALEPKAASGYGTGPALADQLKAATTPAPSAVAAPADAGVLDRLVESAKGLVTVRRSDDAPVGADAEAVATARAQLQRNDYAGALATLNGLPAEGKSAVAPVIESLEQRQAALATIGGLSHHVLASLAGGTQ
ncbi:hypothetical protein AncyloWKF20_11865 [Ancylobacter sp. WKF20]|uniref:hypothetical protein n=1 Tax=Ancylobacter sp. WKF20 TaxID=3039801 RepID=UPI0024340CA4|nr:hypothetical protein [Ancylobacter sp. WKF20]WGD28516.1 hypothetical protein AncyloWKF20_11865 [Ancylobacter sp. WKF20]